MTRIAGSDFEIEIKGRSGLHYIEGGRTAFLDGEMLTGDFDFVVYSSSCRWKDTGAPLSAAEKQRVMKNLRAAFHANGMRVDVE